MLSNIKSRCIRQGPNFVPQPDSPIAAIRCHKPFMDQCADDPLYRRAGQFNFARDLSKTESTGVRS